MTPAPTVEDTAEENTEKSREERRATGRTIAIVIFVILMCTAIYHVIQKKTTVLTGVRASDYYFFRLSMTFKFPAPV